MMSNSSNVFWMYCTLLFILTLISSFGGSIRYQENFLEEVFNMIDGVSDEQPFENVEGVIDDSLDNYKQLNNDVIVEEEEPIQYYNDEHDDQHGAEPQIIEPPTGQVQLDSFDNIEGFSGDVWAAW